MGRVVRADRVRRVGLVNADEGLAVRVRTLIDGEPDLAFVATGSTVKGVLCGSVPLDVALLELRLLDDSDLSDNVEALRRAGAGVLVFTADDELSLMRDALLAGALGVIRTCESASALVAAIRDVAAGRTARGGVAPAPDLGAVELEDAGLSPREDEILMLYASGGDSHRVARRLGLAIPTVREYVDRIRTKYAQVGRPAPTKIDLFQRAVEDGLLPAPRRRPGQRVSR